MLQQERVAHNTQLRASHLTFFHNGNCQRKTNNGDQNKPKQTQPRTNRTPTQTQRKNKPNTNPTQPTSTKGKHTKKPHNIQSKPIHPYQTGPDETKHMDTRDVDPFVHRLHLSDPAATSFSQYPLAVLCAADMAFGLGKQLLPNMLHFPRRQALVYTSLRPLPSPLSLTPLSLQTVVAPLVAALAWYLAEASSLSFSRWFSPRDGGCDLSADNFARRLLKSLHFSVSPASAGGCFFGIPSSALPVTMTAESETPFASVAGKEKEVLGREGSPRSLLLLSLTKTISEVLVRNVFECHSLASQHLKPFSQLLACVFHCATEHVKLTACESFSATTFLTPSHVVNILLRHFDVCLYEALGQHVLPFSVSPKAASIYLRHASQSLPTIFAIPQTIFARLALVFSQDRVQPLTAIDSLDHQ